MKRAEETAQAEIQALNRACQDALAEIKILKDRSEKDQAEFQALNDANLQARGAAQAQARTLEVRCTHVLSNISRKLAVGVCLAVVICIFVKGFSTKRK